MTYPTAERVRELLDYDAESGVLTWRVQRGSKRAGAPAGCVVDVGAKTPYLSLRIDRQHCYAHQVAWVWMTGEWPAAQIDHKNRNGLDNRFVNLRPATRGENARNLNIPRHNTSGYVGVQADRRTGKWVARMTRNGVSVHIGVFATAEEAARARDAVAEERDGEFARLNFAREGQL